MSSFLWSIGMIGNDSSATAHHQISENIIVNASERKTCLCGLGCCIDQQKKITTQQTQLFQPKFPPREEAFQKNTAVCPSGSLIQLQNSLFFPFWWKPEGSNETGHSFNAAESSLKHSTAGTSHTRLLTSKSIFHAVFFQAGAGETQFSRLSFCVRV